MLKDVALEQDNHLEIYGCNIVCFGQDRASYSAGNGNETGNVRDATSFGELISFLMSMATHLCLK